MTCNSLDPITLFVQELKQFPTGHASQVTQNKGNNFICTVKFFPHSQTLKNLTVWVVVVGYSLF